jgi:hypothetical protein
MQLNASGHAKIQAATTRKLRITLAQSLERMRIDPSDQLCCVINAIKDELTRRSQTGN